MVLLFGIPSLNPRLPKNSSEKTSDDIWLNDVEKISLDYQSKALALMRVRKLRKDFINFRLFQQYPSHAVFERKQMIVRISLNKRHQLCS